MKAGTSEYILIHQKIRTRLGKPVSCEVCNESDRALDWANISGEYQLDTSDWASLCRPCHRDFDGHSGIVREFCRRGHKKIGDNIQVFLRANRNRREYACRACVTLRNNNRKVRGVL